ncbi:hypothetical protein Hanom_Chr03g00219541 [Helianthus anomalus]
MCLDKRAYPDNKILQAKGSDFHNKHNICCILDEKYPNIEPFKDVLQFLKDSRICKALTDRHKCYCSHVRFFWNAAQYVEDEKAIHSAVRIKDENNKDVDIPIQITVDDVRSVLYFKDKDEDPIIAYTKSKFSRPYKFLVDSVIHALGHRKGAYNEASDYIMNIISSLVLNRSYNISQVIFSHILATLKEKDMCNIHGLDDKTKIMEPLVLKKTRWWFVKEEKTRRRTPKVTTPKVVIKGKTKKQESPQRPVDEPIDLPPENVDITVTEE